MTKPDHIATCKLFVFYGKTQYEALTKLSDYLKDHPSEESTVIIEISFCDIDGDWVASCHLEYKAAE